MSETMEYRKPLPRPDEDSQEFWEAVKRHEFRLQRCLDCGTYRFPPRRLCNNCLSENSEWSLASGKGEVYSHVVFHQVYHPAFADEVPYTVATIQLAEGPKMYSNIVGCRPDEIRIGMPVEVCFDDVTAEVTVPRFRPSTTDPTR